MKKIIFLCVAAGLLFSCANHKVMVRTVAEMAAEEIGIAVAQNNEDPRFITYVELYYDQLQDLSGSDDRELFVLGLKVGIEYLLEVYAGDDITSKRIASKVLRLLELSGLDKILEMPEDGALLDIDPDYILDVVGAFLNGVHMAK